MGREIAVHVNVVILKLNPNMLKFRRRANAIFTRMTKMTIALFKILRFRERADAMFTMMIKVANAFEGMKIRKLRDKVFCFIEICFEVLDYNHFK